MNTFALPDTTSWQGATQLSHLAPILAEGPDAATFLHGQLSQDVQNLPQGESRPAAYCSAKGRMLADALLFRPGAEQFLLLMDAAVLPATLKRLQMFVLRSKAKLSDARADCALIGLVGQTAIAHLAPLPAQAHGVSALSDGAFLIRLPDVQGLVRAIWVGPSDQVAQVLEQSGPLPLEAWRWLEVMSGVPRIEVATVDQFVPQMVNFEIIGGVNFKKGCYPGQEVVARSQYRGTLKRRLHLAHCLHLAQAGQEIFSADDPGQPAGLVVNAAAIPGGQGSTLLMELKLQHASSRLTLASPEGPTLSVGSLPYEVPAQDAA
jgi:tRNA-modifying protein YgfZ